VLNIYKPSNYIIAVYIKVENFWSLKGITKINKNKTWEVDITQKNEDCYAKHIAVFLLPSNVLLLNDFFINRNNQEELSPKLFNYSSSELLIKT